jgi:hypothetical protein
MVCGARRAGAGHSQGNPPEAEERFESAISETAEGFGGNVTREDAIGMEAATMSRVLDDVRAELKTPEGRSIIEWATETMIRLRNAETENERLRKEVSELQFAINERRKQDEEGPIL